MSVTEQVDEITPPKPNQTPPEQSPDRRLKSRPFLHRPGVVWCAALVAVAGIIFVAMVMVRVLTHETTDDAFIDGHVVSIAPKVSGKISVVNAGDNQEVRKGDTLFEIDPRDYEAAVAQKKAALDVAIAKQKSAEAAVEQANVHMKTLQAAMDSVKASADASQVSATLSHSDLKRYQELIHGGVVSAQDFEHTKSAAATADANLISKVKELDAAAAYADEARAQRDSSSAQAVAAQAEVNQAKATLAQAELQLSYTKVLAPEDGRVTSKTVEAGDYVQIGQALMAVVPHDVWMTANFKETQITDMRRGQPVAVEVDAYPGRKLRAHVDSIQAGSGARFSLLPPENATGNFVKVVQRVPVKIVFDEQMDVQRVLGPGMSAVPEVKVKDALVPAIIVTIFAALAIIAVIAATLFWLGKIRAER